MKKEYMTRKVTLNADSLTRAMIETTVELTDREQESTNSVYAVSLGLTGSLVNSSLSRALFGKEKSTARTITGQEYAAAAAEALHEMMYIPEGLKQTTSALMSRSTALGHGALILFTAAEKFFGREEEAPAEEAKCDDN